MSIFAVIPNPEELLTLAPEELAGYVMEYLNGLPHNERNRINVRNHFGHRIYKTQIDWPSEYRNTTNDYRSRIAKALMEAWVWLLREGFVAPDPEQEGCFFITRRGERIKGTADLDAIRMGDLLPRKILHPVIAQKVWSLFLRGEYDTAVFQAFKEVEVAVRDGGSYAVTDIGTDLMRKAFNEKKGALTDASLPYAEQQSLAHLFAGAIGLYKNPHSHRHVGIDAVEAVELIMLASHLLRIVDARTRNAT